MDHALSTRAPQTGSPPSPDWSLQKTSSLASESGFATYGVLDAVGVRLGTVSGWVRTPDGEVAGLCVDLRGLTSAASYLIPLGYVTGVDPRHRTIHLREMTRRNMTRVSASCAPVLPPPEVLESILHEAPTPRPEIVSVFRNPEQGPLFSRDTPLVVPVKRAESPPPAFPMPTAVLGWRPLKHRALPAWQPLDGLGTPPPRPESEPYWL